MYLITLYESFFNKTTKYVNNHVFFHFFASKMLIYHI